ncbi:MAG: hypothetical protein WBG71_08950 [Leeuwenhoekiella sp.]
MKKEKEFLENWTTQQLSNMKLEQPSMGFNRQVMQAVHQLKTDSKKFEYTPLISKKIWAVIAACIIGIVVVMFSQGESFTDNSEFVDIDKWTSWAESIPNMKLPELPRLLSVSLLILSLMLLIEISVIKKLYQNL